MKVALEIMGGVLATLVVGVAIFYFGWLRPPSPASVCENVVAVSKAEFSSKGGMPSEAIVEALRKECVATASNPPEYGRGPWVRRLECMRDATSYARLKTCEQIHTM